MSTAFDSFGNIKSIKRTLFCFFCVNYVFTSEISIDTNRKWNFGKTKYFIWLELKSVTFSSKGVECAGML